MFAFARAQRARACGQFAPDPVHFRGSRLPCRAPLRAYSWPAALCKRVRARGLRNKYIKCNACARRQNEFTRPPLPLWTPHARAVCAPSRCRAARAGREFELNSNKMRLPHRCRTAAQPHRVCPMGKTTSGLGRMELVCARGDLMFASVCVCDVLSRPSTFVCLFVFLCARTRSLAQPIRNPFRCCFFFSGSVRCRLVACNSAVPAVLSRILQHGMRFNRICFTCGASAHSSRNVDGLIVF